jgi:DNA-binding CsgD family transcriptional regulator
MAAGLVRKQVAEKLKLSVRTVDHHVKIIYLKLNARNAAHAVALVKA